MIPAALKNKNLVFGFKITFLKDTRLKEFCLHRTLAENISL